MVACPKPQCIPAGRTAHSSANLIDQKFNIPHKQTPTHGQVGLGLCHVPRASGWAPVGTTRGRGQPQTGAVDVSLSDIYNTLVVAIVSMTECVCVSVCVCVCVCDRGSVCVDGVCTSVRESVWVSAACRGTYMAFKMVSLKIFVGRMSK